MVAKETQINESAHDLGDTSSVPIEIESGKTDSLSNQTIDLDKKINEQITEKFIFLKKLQDDFTKLKQKTEVDLKKYKREIEDNKHNLEDKIENGRLSTIESLGIFVALFTFISIEFQVFRSYRNPFAISGLTLIFIGSIFLFLVVLDYLIIQVRGNESDKARKSKKGKLWYVLPPLSVVLISSGMFLYWQSPNEDLEDKQTLIKNQVYNLVKDDIKQQNTELLETNKNNEFLIDDLKNNLDSIKNCVNNFGFTYKCFK